MKRISMLAAAVAVFGVVAPGAAHAAATLRYHNGDSKKHTFPVKCSGSSYTVSFDASTTSSVTIQGSAPCHIQTGAGEVVVKGGEDVEIKDGKLKIK